MTKPQWLIDNEYDATPIHNQPKLCGNCIYFGKFVKMTKHKDKEKCEVHECDIHPGCMNTKFSVCCDDWTA